MVFAHFSVKEYLTSTRIAHGPTSCFQIIDSVAHGWVSKLCLVYLLSVSRRGLTESSPSSAGIADLGSNVLKQFRLVTYAAEGWLLHYQFGNSDACARTTDLARQLLTLAGNNHYNYHWLRLDAFLHYLSAIQHKVCHVYGYRYSATMRLKGYSPLQYSIVLGLQTVTELILRDYANVNSNAENGLNSLVLAIMYGKSSIVKQLLELGANPDTICGDYGHVLQAASYWGDETVVKLLLESGANVNIEGGWYGNSLQAAARAGNKDIAQLLLQAGANINAKGGWFGSALQAASSHGHATVVELLLRNGAKKQAAPQGERRADVTVRTVDDRFWLPSYLDDTPYAKTLATDIYATFPSRFNTAYWREYSEFENKTGMELSLTGTLSESPTVFYTVPSHRLIPPSCPVYYFEVEVVSSGVDGYLHC